MNIDKTEAAAIAAAIRQVAEALETTNAVFMAELVLRHGPDQVSAAIDQVIDSEGPQDGDANQ